LRLALCSLSALVFLPSACTFSLCSNPREIRVVLEVELGTIPLPIP
jgi:hypothetical protein